MAYTLTKIINDKKLRDNLVKSGFTLKDKNGVFALDFQNQPAKKNHLDTFGKLFELGGDDFMQYLLEKGGTCLTDDPNAVKQGVQPIAGTDKFFLKTNASKAITVASVLQGIYCWSEYVQDFDADAVVLYALEEQPEEDEEMDMDKDMNMNMDETEVTTDIFDNMPQWHVAGFSPLAFRDFPVYKNCSLATKKDKLCFYDEDAQKFIKLYCYKGSELLPLDGMVNCEPLKDAYDEHFGYKYQMTESGKWGYISKYFAQIMEPMFDDIVVTSDVYGQTVLFAYRKHEKSPFEISNDSFNPFEEENPDNSNPFEEKTDEEKNIDLFYSRTATYSEDNLRDQWFLNNPDFSNVDELFKPDRFVRLDYATGENGETAVLYKPYSDANIGICNIGTEDSFIEETWHITYKDPSMTMNNKKADKTIHYPCARFDADACLRAMKPIDLDLEISNLWKLQRENLYVATICREGYYAVAEMKLADVPEIKKILVPFAFTEIVKIADDIILVDRFGKKGAYDLSLKKYVVPCDYEEIKNTERGFYVSRMGFTGLIDPFGSWSEHLHKEQN